MEIILQNNDTVQTYHLDDYAFVGTPEALERFVSLEQEFAQIKTLMYQMDPRRDLLIIVAYKHYYICNIVKKLKAYKILPMFF